MNHDQDLEEKEKEKKIAWNRIFKNQFIMLGKSIILWTFVSHVYKWTSLH